MGRGKKPRPFCFKECPRWDSNPHCADFKSAASADWATRAIGTDYF